MSKRMQELLAKVRAKQQEQQAPPQPLPSTSKLHTSEHTTKIDALKRWNDHIEVTSDIKEQAGKCDIVIPPPAIKTASNTISKMDALRAKLAAVGMKHQIPPEPPKPTPIEQAVTEAVTDTLHVDTTDRYGNHITYNAKQRQFVQLASEGNNCILIGAAGTGKTTCMQGTVQNLIQSGKAGVLEAADHKHLVDGTPGIVVVAYTRRAVNNIRKAMPEDMKNNCITIHKLLEYEPAYFEVEDPETGTLKRTMQFLPSRNNDNKLPASITTLIVEEASMPSIELWAEVLNALPHKVQIIMLGDLNQLPPVFGSAILGYKLLTWPVVELDEVYRQALESPIIRLAHRILSGKPIPASEYEEWKYHNQLTIHPWKKKLNDELAVRTLAAFFTQAINNNIYDPMEDMILIPFNKACGTIELNKHIANHLARKKGLPTYEVMAGFNKHYFTVGDKVLYDKEDAEIVSIETNHGYTGGKVQHESKFLDYWGYNKNAAAERYSDSMEEDDIDLLLEQVASNEERVTKSSHKIVVRLLDAGSTISIDTAAGVNSLLLSYALTVHKAQGSEWNKVFVCFHKSHATMLLRELLYTAVTRAKEELYVICEPESFTNGINNQKIKGNTLTEKAEFFKGKVAAADSALLSYVLED